MNNLEEGELKPAQGPGKLAVFFMLALVVLGSTFATKLVFADSDRQIFQQKLEQIGFEGHYNDPDLAKQLQDFIDTRFFIRRVEGEVSDIPLNIDEEFGKMIEHQLQFQKQSEEIRKIAEETESESIDLGGDDK